MGFQHFENNFMKETRNNFRITETLDLDNTLCEILTLESDTENVVRKYQDSIVAASKKSFKVRQLMQKTRFQVGTLVDGRTYCNGKENQRHVMAIPANNTGQQLAGNQETPILAGEKAVRSHSKESKGTFVETILQRHNVGKPVEHGI